MDIKVDIKEGEGCNILNVCGDVDVYTSPKVKESINALTYSVSRFKFSFWDR